MITDKDLQEAIAKCLGKVDPFPDDAILLAACYTIQEHNRYPEHSFASAETPIIDNGGVATIGNYGDSEFLSAVRGKDPAVVWPIINELMDTLSVVNPRVYDGVMRQINR